MDIWRIGVEYLNEQNIKNAEYYGYERQAQQTIEECSELIQAISKYNRLLNGEYAGKDKKIIDLSELKKWGDT